MTDQSVTVPSQSSGVKIDASEITQTSGTVAERQRVNLSDPEDPNLHAKVIGPVGDGKLATSDQQLLAEIKSIRLTLEEFTTKLTFALKL